MSKDRSKPVLPGEKLAVPEEYEGGNGTYSDMDTVRALAVGRSSFGMKNRVVNVESSRIAKTLPRPGDRVIGQVEAGQGNVKIHYVNGKMNESHFTGMLIRMDQPPVRRGRRKTIVHKLGDLVRATVVSSINGVIHLSMERPEDGVIHTSCSICGCSVTRERERIRCTECGTAEQRKLACDFGKVSFPME